MTVTRFVAVRGRPGLTADGANGTVWVPCDDPWAMTHAWMRTPLATTPWATLTPSALSKLSAPARCRRPELVEAAIARTEAVNPTLNGLAYEAFDRARGRAHASPPYGGFFDGVPTFIKDNVAVAGMPTMQGTDAWDPRPMPADGDVRAGLPGHRADPAWQDADVGVRLQRVGRTPADRAGAQPVGSRLHRGRLVVGRRCIRGRRCGADRARQRRRRVDPNPGGRATASSGSSRRAAGCRWTRRPRQMPLHLVANGVLTPVGPRHRGVSAGSRAGLPQPQAATDRRCHPRQASSGCASRSAPNPLCEMPARSSAS